MKTGFTTNPQLAAEKLGGYSKPPMGVEVGVLPSAQDYDDGTDVVMVARFHEFAPESNYNKWLKKSVAWSVDKYGKKAMLQVLRKSDDDARKRVREMSEFGDTIADGVQNAILHKQVNLPINASSTLAQKDGSTPMVDSSHLISVIDSKVYIDD